MCIICAGLLFPHAAVSNGRRSRHSNGRPFCKICRAATGQNCDAYLTLGAMAYEWKPGELFNADALHENIKSRFPRDTLPNDPRLEHALRSAYQTDSAVSRADFVPN